MPLKLTKPLVFFDIESTGLNVAVDRIVEIALMKIHPDQVQEKKVYRFNPGIPIPEEVTAIHGITNEDVADAPHFEDKAREILEFFGDADVAGYNSNRFDVPMLVEELLRSDLVFDTKNRRFVDVFKIFTTMERRDLEAAYQFYCDKDLKNAHSAEVDIDATYEVLLAQLDRYDVLTNDIKDLHEISKEGDFVDLGRRMIYINEEPHFNFGKYKGRKVKEVLHREPQYYDWIMRSEFMLDTKQKLKEIKLLMKSGKL